MTIGERIRQRREELGISQTALADAVNSTKQNIYKYETGAITNIPSDKIEQIAAVLHVTPSYLMGWEESRTEINERIKQRRKELGLSAEQVADMIGVSPATVYRYESSDIKNMPAERLKPIADALHTTPEWLMGWSDKIEQRRPEPAPLPDNLIPIRMGKPLPLIGNIACGRPVLAEENVEELVACPEDIHADFCLRCKGDSMIGCRIMDGDIVYIRQQDDVDDGQIAAVLIEDEATLKRVYKIGHDRIELRPENPIYPVMTYVGSELDRIRILGLAVAFTSPVK